MEELMLSLQRAIYQLDEAHDQAVDLYHDCGVGDDIELTIRIDIAGTAARRAISRAREIIKSGAAK